MRDHQQQDEQDQDQNEQDAPMAERRAPQRFTWMDRALITGLIAVGIWIGVNTTKGELVEQRLSAVERLGVEVARLSNEQVRTDERYKNIEYTLGELRTGIKELTGRRR